MNTIKQYATSIIIILVTAGVVMLLVNMAARHNTPPPGVAVIAKPASAVAKLDKVEIIPAKVKAYPHKAKAKLGLPDPVVSNPSIYALSATTVKPDIRPVTVSTTLDKVTGDVVTYATREPLPWLAIPMRGEAGIAYGLKNGQPNTRLFARQSLLDIKAVRLGVEVAADQDGDAFVGISAAYRW